MDCGILSEAGCPAIADPGAIVVNKAHQKGIEVVPLVGPSSILLALMGSGLNGQSFAFVGYLPIQKQDRINAIKKLEIASRKNQQTQIFMETPYRNQAFFQDLIRTCQPNTKICVAKHLTAPNEFIKTLKAQEWLKLEIALDKEPTIFLLQST